MRRFLIMSIIWAFAMLADSSWSEITPFVHEGVSYVRLDDLARFYGGELVPTPDERVVLRTRWAEVVFAPDERTASIGGSLVWLHEPMKRIRSYWAINQADARNVIDPVMRPGEYMKKAGSRVVVLDPGHGGADSGARGKGRRGIEEKYAALDIARRVRTHLTAAGLKVYMTRENDRFIELEERARKAKRLGADLFVSIHLNSAGNSSAVGTETFVMTSAGYASTVGGSRSPETPGNKFDAENMLLGFHLQRSIIRNVKPIDRGLKHARFIVLRNAPCPAALVECGFLSNPQEERKFTDEAYREQIAQGIVKGILVYVGLARQAQKDQP